MRVWTKGGLWAGVAAMAASLSACAWDGGFPVGDPFGGGDAAHAQSVNVADGMTTTDPATGELVYVDPVTGNESTLSDIRNQVREQQTPPSASGAERFARQSAQVAQTVGNVADVAANFPTPASPIASGVGTFTDGYAAEINRQLWYLAKSAETNGPPSSPDYIWGIIWGIGAGVASLFGFRSGLHTPTPTPPSKPAAQ